MQGLPGPTQVTGVTWPGWLGGETETPREVLLEGRPRHITSPDDITILERRPTSPPFNTTRGPP